MKTAHVLLVTSILSAATLAACGNSATNTTGGDTSSEALSSVSAMPVSSMSAAMMESSSSLAAMMQTSSSSIGAMTQSSAGNASLAAQNGTVPDTIQNFFISALHQSTPDSSFVSASSYLTDTFKSSLQTSGNIPQALFCSSQKPNNFTFAAQGASQTQRTVTMTEMFHAGANVTTTVSVVHQSDGWKVDSVTCQ